MDEGVALPEISKTADQALALLLSIGEDGPDTAAALADRLGMHRTVAHRLLATLEGRGFVRRGHGGYELGMVLRRLAADVEPELLQVARPIMEELSQVTGEATVLSVLEGKDLVTAELVPGTRHLVRVTLDPGYRHPLHVGAAGRAILAHLPDRIRRAAADSSPTPEALQAQLEEIRRAGYAYSHDELQEGVSGIAVPVFQGGTVSAGLSLVVPISRDTDLKSWLGEIVGAATRMSDALEAARENAEGQGA
ncbi:IclR family transcriptional regulator [Streptomyces sp. NBC_00878]|uniref:IclR family transcriptional regulator n=1 Tax=Streptomyces sp. NBC_00878 TaxID=2975854 RepID=UPI00225B49D0|nr:IclR family transcriptional regulator [Streptomyces sp. NBC_00878]MCX4903401.1 IclR family transcriptional regulator [Streptomyces sp. NBC_00878]